MHNPSLTFADFLAEMPGLTEYARAIYLRLDAEAVRIGTEIAGRKINYRALAADQFRRGAYWLAGVNRDLADALDRDIRYAAMPALYAAAMEPDSVGRAWVNWYHDLLGIYFARRDGCPPRLVAAA